MSFSSSALTAFHPAVGQWFESAFAGPTPAQEEAWSAIGEGKHCLIAAPTGSGKTLAAFLSAIDGLVRRGLESPLIDETYVLYVSPLKALSNDIQKNLQFPLSGINDVLTQQGLPAVPIVAQVRTGDTSAAERAKMVKKPPHILVTTPESLYILLTSQGGRDLLHTVRTVIIDEIHAVIDSKRGAHLSLSLERLQALTQQPITRIGLSATQKPIETVRDFLVGNRQEDCLIVDSGHQRERDLAIEVTASPVESLMSNEVWQEVYDRLAQLIDDHTTTLIFVNNRRLCERATRFLAERIGEEAVAAHHGSLAKEHRLDAEQRLKSGTLRVMVATASMELGIDIGDVDLVCQIGSPKGIASFLQRVGRSGHAVGATPKGRLFPTSRDSLVECTALLYAVNQGKMDTLSVYESPLDVLSQQLIAEVASQQWDERSLFNVVTSAWPYRSLSYEQYDDVLAMIAEGFATRRGRRSAYIYRDEVNKQLRPRKSARLTAVTNAGAIPDQFDYDVILEPKGLKIGTLNEDFSIESLPGDIFQLGNQSYRILKIETGTVRVEDAQGLPPSIPFWLGYGTGRTDELSVSVSQLRAIIHQHLLDEGQDETIGWLVKELRVSTQVAVQLVEYLAATQAALDGIPTQKHIFFERFFDETGDHHIVIHSPYGSRINRAWGLALRKKFCRKFNFELQAAALEDSIVISLGSTHSFPLEEVIHYLQSGSIKEVVTQAILQAPLFPTQWRWDATIALAVKRNQGGQRVPPQFQRNNAEDLVAVVFPDQIACQDNIVGEREVPEHPLVNQTLYDCLNDVMDIEGLEKLLVNIEQKNVTVSCCDLVTPSPLAHEILTAKPYAFLDDAPAEERRTRAVNTDHALTAETARDLGRLDADAIDRVQQEAWPNANSDDEIHDALITLAVVSEEEAQDNDWLPALSILSADQRATKVICGDRALWVSAERLCLITALHPQCEYSPSIKSVGSFSQQSWQADNALVELCRSRLQGVGPVTELALAALLGVDENSIYLACLALEQEGYAMQGEFMLSENVSRQWCERGLLARIHRYTLKRRRNDIKPVTAAEMMMFLFQWHGMGDEKPSGPDALANCLRQLEGYSISAGAWESDILPARIEDYSTQYLDQLCLSGVFTWLRLPTQNGIKNTAHKGPIKTTPIAFIERSHQPLWQTLQKNKAACVDDLSHPAQHLFKQLQEYGASFYSDLSLASGMLNGQKETALGELVSSGLINADSFAGVRSLISPIRKKHQQNRRLRRRHTAMNSLDSAGRWSIVRPVAEPLHDEYEDTNVRRWLQTPYDILEQVVDTLLHRYGVVFKKILEKENNLPPWRELLYVLRRLEARGEIRGGRFVEGFSGEQFAHPDAVGLLRKQHQRKEEQLISINAADPLNLLGVILPGAKISAYPSNRILFKNGEPIAVLQSKEVIFLGKASANEQWQYKNYLMKPHNMVSTF